MIWTSRRSLRADVGIFVLLRADEMPLACRIHLASRDVQTQLTKNNSTEGVCASKETATSKSVSCSLLQIHQLLLISFEHIGHVINDPTTSVVGLMKDDKARTRMITCITSSFRLMKQSTIEATSIQYPMSTVAEHCPPHYRLDHAIPQ